MYSLQIANTKTNDNQQTLMHFLATMAEKHYPDVMDFADELLHVEKATRGMTHSFAGPPACECADKIYNKMNCLTLNGFAAVA